MISGKRASTLVVDANGILNGTWAAHLADTFYTVPEVLTTEIRDDASRARLAALPCALKEKSPSSEALSFVNTFARKTGDESALSLIDVRLVALAVTIEKEARGSIQHLRQAPLPVQARAGKQKMDSCLEPSFEACPKNITGVPTEQPSRPGEGRVLENESENDSEKESECEDEEKVVNVNDDGDGDWITPCNIHLLESMGRTGDPLNVTSLTSSSSKESSLPSVAVMTSDFAMQNVLMQMGIPIVSLNGYLIRTLKHWVLRCHACYKITKETKYRFCPACGGPTLIRTSYSLDAQTGEVILHLNRHFQYNNRGTIYSIPSSDAHHSSSSKKHGKGHFPNQAPLILRADQKEYERGIKRYEWSLRKVQNDPDSVPFLLQSTSLREKQASQFLLHPPVIGHGRRNVNQVGRKS